MATTSTTLSWLVNGALAFTRAAGMVWQYTGFTGGGNVNFATLEASASAPLTGTARQFFLGHNIGASGGVETAGEPALYFAGAINQFARGVGNDVYGNISCGTIATDGTSRPFWSFEWPHANIAGLNAQGYIRFAALGLDTWTGDYRLLTFDTTAKRVLMGNTTSIRGVNNYPVVEAINAAGSGTVELLKLNASNVVQYVAPLQVVNSKVGTAGVEIIPPSGVTSGTGMFSVNGGTSTGSVYSLNAITSASTGNIVNVQNNANATNAKALLYLQALYANSGCDVAAYYNNIGVGGTACDFIQGVDQSALAFVLSQGGTLGTNNVFSVDKTNLNVAFTKPPKLPSYTAATLPSASAYDGCITMVSDANSTTARSTVAGGGANKVLAFSDGTNWLIAA